MKNYTLRNLLAAVALVGTLLFHSPAQASTTFQCPLANTTYVTAGGDQFTSDGGGVVTNTGGGRNNLSLFTQGCDATIANPGFNATNPFGNAAPRTIVGTTTVAAINAAGNTILTGVTGKKIYVLSFDLVATGTPATCTGVFLQDSNGTPVNAATVLVAALTSGTHALPLAANVNAGFASTGLTAGANLQLNVDGSACTTMTSMAYAVTYILQ
jgi:hypothetical protein